MALNRADRRRRIHHRIRKSVSGTAQKPRLAVFRSNTAINVQLIDDVSGKTLASASSKGLGSGKSVNVELAKQVGQQIAEKGKSAGIETVVFDRGGYLYHGKIKALADGAREAGLKF
jgi:large subunit ribosomal protein L18